jgi:hypothetical protein
MRHSCRAIAVSNQQYAAWIEEKSKPKETSEQKPRTGSVGLALLKARIGVEFTLMPDDLQVRRIKDAACEVYGVAADTLDRKPIPGEVSKARQIALYLCDQTTSLSYTAIGKLFCYRDHTAVSHTIKKARSLMNKPDRKTQEALVAICDKLEARIKSPT